MFYSVLNTPLLSKLSFTAFKFLFRILACYTEADFFVFSISGNQYLSQQSLHYPWDIWQSAIALAGISVVLLFFTYVQLRRRRNMTWYNFIKFIHFSDVSRNNVFQTTFVFSFVLVTIKRTLVQCSISIPPENVRKPKVFWRFQGLYK